MQNTAGRSSRQGWFLPDQRTRPWSAALHGKTPASAPQAASAAPRAALAHGKAMGGTFSIPSLGTKPLSAPRGCPGEEGPGLRDRREREDGACARRGSSQAHTDTRMPGRAGGGCLFPLLLIPLCSSLASTGVSWGSCGLSAPQTPGRRGLGKDSRVGNGAGWKIFPSGTAPQRGRSWRERSTASLPPSGAAVFGRESTALF